MRPASLLVYSVVPLLSAAAWWAAREATDLRERRTEELVAALPGALPTLNPFIPGSEVEREIIDLIYEPLLRVGLTGEIEPALASHWDWSQQVTCWFVNADVAAKAADHLKALDADRWISWGLNEVNVRGSEIVLRFADPTSIGPDEALKEVADFEPLPVDFLRIRLKGQARSYHALFMEHAIEGAQVRREWFDGDRLCELVVSGAPGNAVEEMRQYYQARPELEPELALVARVAALREPVLEFRLQRERFWPDQTPVTAEDMIATVRLVLDQRWPVQNRDAFRLIQSLEAPAPDRLRVVYRQFYGAALCGWMQLPVLPAAWLEARAGDPPGRLFEGEPAPGSGPFRIRSRDNHSLVLDAAPETRARFSQLRFQISQSPLMTQAGFATHTIDVFWPPPGRLPSWRKEKQITLRSSPPRSRLLVIWNTRQSPLADARVREALTYATDRQALVDELVHGAGGIEEGLFKPGMWFSETHPVRMPDPVRAARELDEAGWLRDVNSGLRKSPAGTLSIELLTTAGNAQRERLAELLAAQWREIGIEVRITPLPWSTLVDDRLFNRQFDAAILGLDFETSWDQLPFWHSSQSGPGGLNFTGVADREVDLLLEALGREFDPAAVPARARQLEQRLQSLHAVLPLFTDLQPAALRVEVMPPLLKEQADEPLTLRHLVMLEPTAEKTPEASTLQMRLPEEAAAPTEPAPPPPPDAP